MAASSSCQPGLPIGLGKPSIEFHQQTFRLSRTACIGPMKEPPPASRVYCRDIISSTTSPRMIPLKARPLYCFFQIDNITSPMQRSYQIIRHRSSLSASCRVSAKSILGLRPLCRHMSSIALADHHESTAFPVTHTLRILANRQGHFRALLGTSAKSQTWTGVRLKALDGTTVMSVRLLELSIGVIVSYAAFSLSSTLVEND